MRATTTAAPSARSAAAASGSAPGRMTASTRDGPGLPSPAPARVPAGKPAPTCSRSSTSSKSSIVALAAGPCSFHTGPP
ncbi:hypothetical protein BJF78_12920 [Pseudonocardia sp. CNS-139]|nr:hypothetical protein BJF78_12920 [Pseudonocardia sp. CNS-139]